MCPLSFPGCSKQLIYYNVFMLFPQCGITGKYKGKGMLLEYVVPCRGKYWCSELIPEASSHCFSVQKPF